MEQLSEGRLPDFNHRVDVIWHETPGEDVVTFAVEMQQVLLHQRGDGGMAERTVAVAQVKIRLDLESFLVLVLERQQRLPLVAPAGGQGIGHAIGQELPNTGRVEVREIPARPPAFETQGKLGCSGLMVPLALGFNNVTDVFAPGCIRSLVSVGMSVH